MATSSPAGQTIVVTGAASGLGKAIATAFLEAGANVAVCDVNETRLKETAAEWAKHDGKFIATRMDITDETAVNDLFASTSSKFGRVDMLINNAGLMDRFDPVGDLPADLWNRVIGVNLTGTFLCTKAAVKTFEAQTPVGGTIINICSISSLRGVAAGAAYTASKHGMLGLTKNTAGIYGSKGIYSLAFIMGAMHTNIQDAFATGMNEEGAAASGISTPGFVMGVTNVELQDVAKFCIFYSDRAMAWASNGTTVNINKNWPSA
ncbi:NAD(P)-binding protein [Xylaria sp. CBS 124048]|nr:NAD(P)-binding protein [Xylaria sp. CBS 124048]